MCCWGTGEASIQGNRSTNEHVVTQNAGVQTEDALIWPKSEIPAVMKMMKVILMSLMMTLMMKLIMVVMYWGNTVTWRGCEPM